MALQRNFGNWLPMLAQKTFGCSLFDHCKPKAFEYLHVASFFDCRHLQRGKTQINGKRGNVTKQGASYATPSMRWSDRNALNVKSKRVSDALGDTYHRIGVIYSNNSRVW